MRNNLCVCTCEKEREKERREREECDICRDGSTIVMTNEINAIFVCVQFPHMSVRTIGNYRYIKKKVPILSKNVTMYTFHHHNHFSRKTSTAEHIGTYLFLIKFKTKTMDL